MKKAIFSGFFMVLSISMNGQDLSRAVVNKPEPAGPLAVVGNRAISEAELANRIQGRLISLESQEYDLKRQALDEAIGEALLEQEASRRAVSVAKLIRSEIDDKTNAVTPEQVYAVYEATRDRYNGKSKDEALKLVEGNLRLLRISLRRGEFLKELRDKSNVAIYLDPPRQMVDTKDSRAKGPANAPVTIVEFAEFQCPFCGNSVATLKHLEGKYGNRIRLVFRDFPLVGFHQDASKSAEAASCANDQGKFWEMYDKLFENQSRLKMSFLKQYASDIGLNSQQFSECLESGKYTNQWQRDIDEGSHYGVTGTPTFFVNGRMLVGSVPFDKFAQVIDEELQRTERTIAPAQSNRSAADPGIQLAH
ncbi:MAG TPA: thioredoxin domain-containing protein [Candidatus Angelobacter sp.]